jgi:hypothetical protein
MLKCDSLFYKQWLKSHYKNLVNVNQEGEDRLSFANAMVSAEKHTSVGKLMFQKF